MALYSLKERFPKINKRTAQPTSLQLRYFRMLRGLLKPAFEYILERLEPIMTRRLGNWARPWRQDAMDDELNAILQAMRDHLLAGVKDTQGILAALAMGTGDKQASVLGKALSIDVKRFSPTYRYMLDTFVEENVPLITSIAEDLLSDVATEIQEAFANGDRWEDLSGALQERFGATESRANLIARTEIAKLNGQFNQRRQQDLGVDEYIWRTVGDERVRDSHKALDGTRQRWDNPPSVGHPGEDFQCRCMADPVIKELEEAA